MLDFISPILLLICGLAIFYGILLGLKKIVTHLTRPQLVVLLLVWISIGFYFNLDYNTQFGCMLTTQYTWATPNIVYSSLAAVLIFCSYAVQNRRYQLYLLNIELCIWLYKLLFIKGGYYIGIGGAPDESILFYDVISLNLRLLFRSKTQEKPISIRYLILINFLVFKLLK